MAATPQGLPYPAATAPVSAGAADIQALATAIDPRLIPPLSGSPPAATDGALWLAPSGSPGGIGGQWLFRYVAAEPSVNKWRFIGGSPYWAQESVAANIGNAWARLTPAYVPLRPGRYIVSGHAMNLQAPAATAVNLCMSLWGANPTSPVIPGQFSTIFGASAPVYLGGGVVTNVIDIPGPDQASFWMHGGAAGVTSNWRAIHIVPIGIQHAASLVERVRPAEIDPALLVSD